MTGVIGTRAIVNSSHVTVSDKELKKDYLLKNLIRFNTTQRIKDESVAEHSFFVVYYTYTICKNLNLDLYLTNKCLIKAILHDTAEIEISDVPHNIKEKYPVLKEALSDAEKNWYKKHHPEYLQASIFDDIINNIVELADVYSVRQYCLNEIALGNTTMKSIVDSSNERIKTIQHKLICLLEKEDY